MGRQHQGMDRPGVRQVPEGSEEQGKIEETGCEIICGQTTGNPFRVTIRIRLKIEPNCRLFWDIFSSAIMNDLLMTFTSRLKVDVKCGYQQ